MKKIIAFILALSLVLPLSAFAEKKISVSAKSALLLDADSGEVLFSKDPDRKMPMASTTKIMTAVAVIRNADPDFVFTVPKQACGIEGSSMYLYEGEKISVRDLLYGLMLESANDAAIALAVATAGSVEKFVSLMNSLASEIGMTSSHFANPNGLSAKEHYSTARDMSLLFAFAMKDPTFREITGTKRYLATVDGTKRQSFVNHNKLLTTYLACTGGKTGFTKEAGRCLVTSAEKDGKMLICTTLSDPDDWNDHVSLFEYGFSLFEKKTLFEAGEIKVEIPVVGGVAEKAVLTNPEKITANVKKDGTVEKKILAHHFLYAPVVGMDIGKDGGEVLSPCGSVSLSQNGVFLGEYELFVTESVEIYHKPTFFERIKNYIKSFFE